MPFFDTPQPATAQEREALFGVAVIRKALSGTVSLGRYIARLPRARWQQDEVQHALV